MRIVLGSDHAGFALKEKLKGTLHGSGRKIIDLGTDSSEPVDYPDYAEKIGVAILKGEADRGILICGSGIGASITANKIPGIRAGVCHDTYSAHQGVEHDDMNVMVMGARVIGEALSVEIVDAFLGALFTGEARHRKRLEKIKKIEMRYCRHELYEGA